MSRPARTKRGALMLDRLTYNDVTYFTYGFSFFKPYDASGIPEKWGMARDIYMEKWMSFKPFSFGSDTINENKPGNRPWAWWNIDHPTYRRKHLEGVPGCEGEYNNGKPRYYHGTSTYESQAAFLQRKGLLTDAEKEYFEFNEMELSETI